ncbi:MAG: hypothetical protein Q8O88_00830 [bacterium]|nr:hypothetical protein [bacterium]
MTKKNFLFFEKDLSSAKKRIDIIGKREGITFGQVMKAPVQKQIAHVAGYKTFRAKIKNTRGYF